jgi:hypothetical protein
MSTTIEFYDDIKGVMLHRLHYTNSQQMHMRPMIGDRMEIDHVYYEVKKITINVPATSADRTEVFVKVHNCSHDCY